MPKYLSGFAINSHYLIGYKLGLYPNYMAKQKVLTHFFGGMSARNFKDIAHEYSQNQLPQIVKASALDRICYHKEQGHVIVVVSASIRDWLSEWCKSHNLLLISSELEVVDGKITGHLKGKNCHGNEKVVRIKNEFELDNFQTSYGYGDSSGDKEMLSLVDKPYYRIFD